MGDRLGQRRSVVVVGEAGVGKTALLRAAATASGRRVHEGGGLATLSSLSYLPVTRALGREPRGGDHAAVAEDVITRVNDGVLMLDDLHWADVDTLAVLGYLAGSLILLGAVRAGDPGADNALSHTAAAGIEVIELTGLAAEDAADLVLLTNPTLTGDDLSRLLERARGNPLLLEELASGEPSPTLASSLRARLRRMPEEAREAAARMAALARPADVDLLGAGALELVVAGLALVGPDGIAFRHALLGETVLAELSEPDRSALHASLARALPDPGEAGHHYALAGDRETARVKALEAADDARTPAERASHLQLAASCSDGPTGLELQLLAADALLDVGLPAEALSVVEQLASPDPEWQARVHLQRARALGGRGDLEGLEREALAGLELVAGTRSDVELHLRLERVQVPLWKPDVSEAYRLAIEAHDLATAMGKEAARARLALAMAGNYTDTLAGAENARIAGELARASGDVYVERLATLYEAQSLAYSGRPAEACAVTESGGARARVLGMRAWEVEFGVLGLMIRAYQMDGPSPQTAERLLRYLTESPPWLIEEQGWLHLAHTVGELGRDEEARRYLSCFAPSTGWARYLQVAVEANVHWLAGRADAALASARRAAADSSWTLAIDMVRTIEAWSLFELGRPVPLYVRAGEGNGVDGVQPAVDGLAWLGTSGHEARAEGLLREAAERLAVMDVRFELRARWGAGEAARRAGDLKRARATLLALEEELEARSMLPLLRRVRRSLRLAGVVRTQRLRANGLVSGREHEVLALVSEGLTSAEIALRLAVSRATVESHVRSAMRKLGASTRRQAAALVTASPQ